MCFRSERISVEWSQTKSSLEPQRLIKRMQKILKQCNAGEQRKKINKHKQTLKRKRMRLNESWLVSVLHSQKRKGRKFTRPVTIKQKHNNPGLKRAQFGHRIFNDIDNNVHDLNKFGILTES